LFLIKDRAANKCCFNSNYFGVGKKLHSRVKLAREWLDDNHSKYPCLADSGADATSKCQNSTTKPTTSKDGMSLPLPWCVDRVGAITANESNTGEPWSISVAAQTHFNWDPLHSLLTTNLHGNVSVHQSVAAASFPNPPL